MSYFLNNFAWIFFGSKAQVCFQCKGFMWNLKEKAKSYNLETMATFSLQTLFLVHSDP